MEFKKKTIIWEDNNEPPKDYIWIKSDGKAYEYSYSQRKWIESKSISGSGNSESVEANPTIEDDDVTTPLNALKIGESVYTVGGDSDSDLQIVELTYDHIPATGTLSASDLAKLDSDNCLLVMNGKYFRKTFSSDGGIDYKEIGLATVLGGVRSIYFTASKPSGEYTIAYTYPVEANTQTQAATALENIKVGNTTYSIPLAPMIVEGTVGQNSNFVPNTGAPRWSEVKNHMFRGGLVYLSVEDSSIGLASYADVSVIGSEGLGWYAPIVINGTVVESGEGTVFSQDSGEMSWNDAKSAYQNGDDVYLSANSGIYDKIVSYNSDLKFLKTETGIVWFKPID